MKTKAQNADLLLQLIGEEKLKGLREKGLEPVVTLLPSELSESQERDAIVAVVDASRAGLTKAQKLATLGSLGAGVVHEARNILTSVVGYAQIAQRKKNEERRTEFLSTIETETNRAVEMLADFLTFARNRPKTTSRFAINEPVSRAARATRHQLQVHQVSLEVKLSTVNPIISGAPREIEQILVNLILNAQQASKEGSQVQVAVSDTTEGFSCITVSDNGCGIESAALKVIFDPFFTTKSSGTGLGLAISRRIAEEHGGTLTVESTVGQGTTFSLRLPLTSSAGGSTP